MGNIISKQDDEQKAIMHIYAVFVASLVMALVPSVIFAFIALALFTGVLVTAYSKRKKSEAHSLCHNHMTFLIRTIWIGSLFAAPTMALGAAYMLTGLDYSPVGPCQQELSSRMSTSAANIDNAQLEHIVEKCISGFLSANKTPILIGGLIAALPIAGYFSYRLTKGLNRALKGHRIGDPKKWF